MGLKKRKRRPTFLTQLRLRSRNLARFLNHDRGYAAAQDSLLVHAGRGSLKKQGESVTALTQTASNAGTSTR